ncbi:cystatin-SA-like isoform X1 [Sparus aurata]|uniref:cystatin-SA-like isoform X1 n=2 Tax=Sparus aurata TaxID=8175 RepID=UPI0011C0E1B6|nr:cystatin-SA-like isoform X1 [Sparus aurata]
MSVWFCISVCASLCRVVTAQQGMTGQPREVPVNGTEVQAAARFAVVEFNRDNAEDQFAYKLLNITSAKTQVVAGINLILEVRLGRTVCKSSDTSDGEACGLNKELKELWCHFVVTEIPWEDLRVLTQKRCNPHN